MERLRNDTTIRILKTLEEKRLYTEQIADALGITTRQTLRILPLLVKENLVSTYRERGKTYYEIRDEGKSLLWALYTPEGLLKAYKDVSHRSLRV